MVKQSMYVRAIFIHVYKVPGKHVFLARPLWRGPFCCGSFWRCPFLREFHENNFFLLIFFPIF